LQGNNFPPRFTFEKTRYHGEAYELRGEWEEGAAKMEKVYTKLPAMSPFWLYIFRKLNKPNPSFATFANHVEVKEVTLGGPKFHEQAVEQICFIHRVTS
jgi:hypothetical protein